jgi:hypothetical protein
MNVQNFDYPEDRKAMLFEQFKRMLFEERDKLLQDSDKYLLEDFPVIATKENILKYRQDLRDYTKLSVFENFDGDYLKAKGLLPKLRLNVENNTS